MQPPASQQLRRSAMLPHVEMRQAFNLGACYDTHTHDELSVGVIDAGQAVYRNGPRLATVRPGSTVLVNPGAAHSCNPRPGQPWSYRMLYIDARWVAGLQVESALPAADGSAALFTRTHTTAPAVYRRFGALFEALEHADNPLAADAQLVSFLVELCGGPGPNGLGTQWPPAPNAPLQRARDCILDQLSDNVTLDALASAAGLSRYHLVRSFKQAYGQTPHAFQLDQRINRGKQLLKRGSTLVDVAQSLGFADQSHFQRHFKKRHAVTPKVYQQSMAPRPV